MVYLAADPRKQQENEKRRKGSDTVCVNSQVSYLQGCPRKLYLAWLREFLSEGKGAGVFIYPLIHC